MKQFKDSISLVKNSRGCWIIDTVKGCSVCASSKPHGCYGDCYAKRIASRYGIDFGTPVSRRFDENKQYALFDFVDGRHEEDIVNQVNAIDMPFVRIGDMGDPSEDWFHTLKVCATIHKAGKQIVIITKHWKRIPNEYLGSLRDLGIIINTSVSALDSASELRYRLGEYLRLSDHCKSVLRVVSCDFNTETREGLAMDEVQEDLLRHDRVIDTILRPSSGNSLVTSGVIKIEKVRFMRAKVLASRHDESVFMGMCSECPDMCGVNL